MTGLVAPLGEAGNAIASPSSSLDPTLLLDYLVNLLEATLGAKRDQLESHGSLLSRSNYADTLQRCTRFARESQVALYVQRDVVSVDAVNGSNPATDLGMMTALKVRMDSLTNVRSVTDTGHLPNIVGAVVFIGHHSFDSAVKAVTAP